jgi:hypothetical protein
MKDYWDYKDWSNILTLSNLPLADSAVFSTMRVWVRPDTA